MPQAVPQQIKTIDSAATSLPFNRPLLLLQSPFAVSLMLSEILISSYFDLKSIWLIAAQVKPFRLYYATNGDESKTATVDATGVGNQGFCFNYLEKTN